MEYITFDVQSCQKIYLIVLNIFELNIRSILRMLHTKLHLYLNITITTISAKKKGIIWDSLGLYLINVENILICAQL